MYEKPHEPLLPFGRFIMRMALHLLAAFVLIVLSLAFGIWGFMAFGALHPIAALMNSAMLLTGMGLVSAMTTDAGMLFATVYALYSGLIFLILVSLFFTPLLHRFLHHFHLEVAGEETQP